MSGKMFESEFEEGVIQLLQDERWDYTFGGNLHRMISDPILEDDLRSYLQAHYADKGLLPEDYDMIVAKIRNIGGSSDYNALANTYNLYHDGFDFVKSGIDPFKLEYIDFEHPDKNIFRVVNQFEMQQGNNSLRIPDILLFINGIPVCIFELKNPTDENATIRDAHTQITVRYRRDIPALLKYCAVACISDGSNSRLGTTFTPYEFFYAWKKVENEDEPGMGIKELTSLIKGVFKPARFLEILRDFVYFPDQSGGMKEEEIICRYPQFFAARKLCAHVLKHLRSTGGDGKGGIYFGATGCGKTYTMLFLSRLLALRCRKELGSPTIILIVDREDLENQAAKLFCKSTKYLCDKEVRVFDSRKDLATELSERETGGFYITTIQKFTESTGLLSDRSNIICMSDEAHRTQNHLGSKLKINAKDKASGEEKLGAFITYGFAKYLRDALPNATYVGFTGTPTDEAIHVFGGEVDRYTMLQSQKDGITVPIKYDPRLARVFLDTKKAEEIEQYYKQCEEEGAKPEDIVKSKKAMSSMNAILGDPDRLERLAKDMIADYETRCADKPDLLQKAMITCSDRMIAYKLYKIIERLRPRWCQPMKALDTSKFTTDELEKLKPVRFVNIVATRAKDDEKDMYDLLGDDTYRKELDTEYKNENSNFHIAIVVDMWITGFDAPPLTILYNDKPLQKHTLIQTISRVNRKYKSKKCGYVVDYIGIRENMKEAMKRYGGDVSPKGDLEDAHAALKNELQILKEMTQGLPFEKFFDTQPLVRLQFLQEAAEFILNNSFEEKGKTSFKTSYKGHVKRLRSAYDICNPAGILTDEEALWAQCFMGIMSFLRKITDTTHDVESMNRVVEQMVKEALACTGVETVLNAKEEEDIFDETFLKELEDVKMPNTKFQLLAKLLGQAIKEYGKVNKVKAEHFTKLLNDTVDQYNTRDKLTFTNEVATDTVNAISEMVEEKVTSLTEKLLDLFKSLKRDKEEFKKLGITFEEKAFYDILVDVRDTHKFEYPEEKCKILAQKIKELVENASLYADWINNDNIRNGLACDLTKLLYKEGYPPEWDDEIFQKVLEQVENFKKYQG